MLWRKIAITSLFLISVAGISNAYYVLPKPTGFISDTANLLSDTAKVQLETDLANFEKTTGNQIVIVTIPSLQNDTIENFAVKLFADWGIGQKDQDNGVLLLISKEDRKIRIEVGYGLEQYLTDAQSSWIIKNQITPNFKINNYDQGVTEAVSMIQKALSGAEVIPESQPTKRKSKDLEQALFYLSLGLFIWLASVMARSKSWWLGGVVGGIIGLILLFFVVQLITGIILTIILSAIGLAFDYGVSKNYDKSKKHGTIIPWWWGGGLGGGHGGGFGGFGGGGSGGGGSSGGW